MFYEPILLKPAFKDYIWGGTKLRTEFGKTCDLDRIAESWELSAHKDGQSVVASGEYAGAAFSDYILKNGKAVLGSRGAGFKDFPILIKFIDAKGDLSIQVHPNDDYALKNEGEYGKTEVWYILSAEEGASLFYGFKKEITRDEYRRRIKDNTITEVLNRVEAGAGDVFFIEPGTVHAIGAGLMICEIQQNSNTTYRVYDYDRKGADGKPRELHIEKAVEVSKLTPSAAVCCEQTVKRNGYTSRVIASCKYFTSERIEICGEAAIPVDLKSFRSVIVTDGSVVLTLGDTELALKKGDSVFIPAQDAEVRLCGSCGILLSYV